jgi:diketogulonate reductase-like aldo/keto reductase
LLFFAPVVPSSSIAWHAAFGAHQPEVNQASLSIGEHDDATIAYCAAAGVVYESFSPLRKGDVLDYPEVQSIAQVHGVSSAQVALKWIVQQGHPLAVAVTDEDYMKEDLDLWSWGDLSEDEMAILSAL